GLSTRPTTDKVRQAVFNSLDSRGVLDGALVVDLFAGSGAMGIEALSRGAESCVFVENDRAAVAALRANLASLRLGDRARVMVADVMSVAGSLADADIALIDPPYTFDQWPLLLGRVRAGLVVAEGGQELPPIDGWQVVRSKRHGRTVITTLEPSRVA
ncbi:MAG TPA: RsmD family RNA methyltransferase, partial [Ilumatobacteraceae bacterium]|nr:RsmD family RNA methyltransferase [Ilumatobacteraceae bacterium]